MCRVLPVVLTVLMFALPFKPQAQTTDEASVKNAQQARVALNAMVQALGGEAWLNMKSQMRQGRVAAFFQGKPSGETTEYWELAGSRPHRVYQAPRRGAVLYRSPGLGGDLQGQSSTAPGHRR